MITRLLFLLLVLFLAFVPLGSAPLYVGPLKLDNAIGLLLAAAVAAHLLVGPLSVRLGLSVLLAGLAYFCILFVSVVLSAAPGYSLQRYLVIAGYAFVALSVPYLFAHRSAVLGRWLFAAGLFSASVIYGAYALLGMSSWGRMTIPTYYPPTGRFEYFPEGWGSSADPNMLAVGLALSVLFFLAVSPLRWRSWAASAYVLGAAALTGSRTAFAALIVSLGMGALLVGLPWLLARSQAVRVRLSGLLAAALAVPGMVWLAVTMLPLGLLIERLLQGDSLRWKLAEHALGVWLDNLKHLVIGAGFNIARSVSDPHNIYLTALHDSGVLGLLGLLTLLAVVLIKALWVVDVKLRFWGVSIFFFIAFSGMTYWHTKTFWVAVMLVLLICTADRRREAPGAAAARFAGGAGSMLSA